MKSSATTPSSFMKVLVCEWVFVVYSVSMKAKLEKHLFMK